MLLLLLGGVSKGVAIGGPPTISTQPHSQAVNPGTSATFTVQANSLTFPTYQWRTNVGNVAGNISGAKSASYTTTNAGSYSVVVANDVGSVTSLVVTLTLRVVITGQPLAKTVAVGDAVQFTVTAIGSPPLTYQWRMNGIPIGGATNAFYALGAAGIENAGNYSVMVTNLGGSVSSFNAPLTVVPLQLQAPQALTGGLQFTVVGLADRSYIVEAADHLTNWAQIGSITLTNGTNVFLDWDARSFSRRYYRARSP